MNPYCPIARKQRVFKLSVTLAVASNVIRQKMKLSSLQMYRLGFSFCQIYRAILRVNLVPKRFLNMRRISFVLKRASREPLPAGLVQHHQLVSVPLRKSGFSAKTGSQEMTFTKRGSSQFRARILTFTLASS